jgi:DNA invertase Pin-like site-specific DNA recombinase
MAVVRVVGAAGARIRQTCAQQQRPIQYFDYQTKTCRKGAKNKTPVTERPASIDVTKVRQLKAKGMGASEIAKALKIGRASVYRVLGERG